MRSINQDVPRLSLLGMRFPGAWSKLGISVRRRRYTVLMFAVDVKLRPYSRPDLPLLSAVEAVCFAPPFRFNQERCEH